MTFSNLALWLEFAVLFVLIPLAFRFKPFAFPPIPALWILAAYCLYRLLNDHSFDRAKLWTPEVFPQYAPQVLTLFAAAVIVIGVAVYFLAPQLLFSFVRGKPAIWGLVMVLYPVLSVYPQGIVYRAFVFERYRPLFPNSFLMIAVSAVAFSFVHIIFRNPIAVGLTLLGGFIFAFRYQESGSLFTSSFEHALYGCFMFTIGLGEFFYKGAR
jgi:membrane protease YdiL (CAAX protease family)